MNNEQVYSEFELEKQFIKVEGQDSYTDISCASTCKVTKTLKKAQKKCRGIVKKSKPKVIGVELEVGVHIPRKVLISIAGLANENLKQGIYGTSRKGTFKTFALTQDIRNEDDEPMLKAYPNCVLSEAPELSIDNSSDEVVETTLKITAMPDENEFFEYEGIKDEMESSTQSAWLENFTSDLVYNKEI